MGYDTFALRMKMTGGSSKQEQIKNARFYTEMLLPDDPSYKKDVEILNKGFVNIRMNNYKIVGGIPQMEIQASLSDEITFNLGDVFVYDNGYWLCTDSREFHDIYKTGKVEECNYLLRWQNPETYEIITRWCVIKDPYASGLDEGKVVSVGNSKYKIKLPYDKETVLLQKDKRFLIDISNNEPIPYKLVRFDGTTNKYESRQEGFLVISLDEDVQRGESDNFELMIADYIIPPKPPTPSIGYCEITYSGEPVIKVSGSHKRFIAIFKDNGGNSIDSITPIWSIEPEEISHKIVISSTLGNEIRLTSEDNSLIGKNFVLKVSGEDLIHGFFECEQKVEITELW